MKGFFSKFSNWFSRTSVGLFELLQSKLGVSALLFTFLYVLAAFFIPELYLVEFGNALLFSFALVVFCLYFPDAVWSARNDKGEAGQYFVVGLALTILYVVEVRAYSTIWRWLDYPEGWLTHPFHAFWLYVGAAGLSMLMTAPGMSKGKVPIKNWRLVAAGVGFSLFLIGVTIGLIVAGQTSVARMPNGQDYLPIICPAEAPIKGTMNNGQRIYHTTDSIHYDSVTNPRVCFISEDDAIANGFREPKPQARVEPLQNP